MQQEQDVASSSSSRSSSPGLSGGLAAAAAHHEPQGAEGDGAPRPPITYLLIYEDSRVSLGIFCLPARARIPLHNHPGMTVLSRCVLLVLPLGACLLAALAWLLGVCSPPAGRRRRLCKHRAPAAECYLLPPHRASRLFLIVTVRPSPSPASQGAVRQHARLLLRLGAAGAGRGGGAAARRARRAGRHPHRRRPAGHPVPLGGRQHPRVHRPHRLRGAGPHVAALLHRWARQRGRAHGGQHPTASRVLGLGVGAAGWPAAAAACCWQRAGGLLPARRAGPCAGSRRTCAAAAPVRWWLAAAALRLLLLPARHLAAAPGSFHPVQTRAATAHTTRLWVAASSRGSRRQAAACCWMPTSRRRTLSSVSGCAPLQQQCSHCWPAAGLLRPAAGQQAVRLRFNGCPLHCGAAGGASAASQPCCTHVLTACAARRPPRRRRPGPLPWRAAAPQAAAFLPGEPADATQRA